MTCCSLPLPDSPSLVRTDDGWTIWSRCARCGLRRRETSAYLRREDAEREAADLFPDTLLRIASAEPLTTEDYL